MCVDRDSTTNRCLTVCYCVVVALSTLKWEIVELLCDVCWQRFYGKSLSHCSLLCCCSSQYSQVRDSWTVVWCVLTEILRQIVAVWKRQFQAPVRWSVVSGASIGRLRRTGDCSQDTVECFWQSSHCVWRKVRNFFLLTYMYLLTYLLTYVVSRCSLLSCLASVMSATRPCFRFISYRYSCLRVIFLTKSKFRFVCVHITMLLNNNLMQKFVDNSRGCCYTVTEECWVLTWGFVIPTSSQAASQQAPQSFLLPATLRGTRSSKMSLRSVHVCCQSQGFLGHFYIRPHELDEVHGGASVNISRKSLLLPQFSTDFGSVYFVW